MTKQLFAITISHQFGSGGAVLGQKLSEHLSVPFFDREILTKVAGNLNVLETDIENREERLSTFWEAFGRNSMMTNPGWIMEGVAYPPSDLELFEVESETILKIAERSSGIFLGRCGFHILREHACHVNILLYADLRDRMTRVKQLYQVDSDAAKKLIQSNDHDRASYVHAFTHQDWLSATLYDICLNTSSLGLEKTQEAALSCITQKIDAV
jgi:cytidylate kinase